MLVFFSFFVLSSHRDAKAQKVYYYIFFKAVMLTGPNKPDGNGVHAEASNKPFFVFSLFLA